MPPRDTIWDLEPHTLGKHLVLRAYLNAWLPIMGRFNQRILFVDGFAGPGIYRGGEDGSPVIAIKAFRDHSARQLMKNATVLFLFIESDRRRFENLQSIVSGLAPTLPPNVETECVFGKFDETLTEVLTPIEEQKQRLAPSFVMIDPFGVSDTPMSIIAKILRNPKSEVYVSFMWDFLDRFKGTPEFEPHLDALFGCPDWRRAFDITDVTDRRRYTFDLYRRCLKDNGAEHVVHFELYEGSRLVYAIFFATKHPLGCEKMKEAIWKIAPFGDYSFRPGRGDSALDLFGGADFSGLAKELRLRFASNDFVPVEDLTRWMKTDETDFYPGQLKRVLKDMENRAEIEVKRRAGVQKRHFPDGTLIRFKRLTSR